MKKFRALNRSFTSAALLSTLIGWTGAQADDVEVYLQEPPERVPPNLMFVLDESGSMDGKDGTAYTRMQDLQTAMNAIISDPDLAYANAAILGFTTSVDSNNGNLRLRLHSDFVNIGANKTALKAKVNALTPLNYTPSVAALRGGVDWFKDGYNSQDLASTGYSASSTTDDTKWDSTQSPTKSAVSPIKLQDFGGQSNVALYCQPNAIILLTDGVPNSNDLPTKDNAKRYGIKTYEGTSCVSDATSVNQSGRCAREIAAWAFNNDFQTGSEWDGKQNVKTYTIGFHTGVGTSAQNYLKSISAAGGGSHYDANNASELVNAFKEIAEEMGSSIAYTYNSPAIPMNTDNAALSGNRIYVPTFKPIARRYWKGNLKKYQLKTDMVDGAQVVSILDKNGEKVVNSDYMFVSSQDYWNTTGNDGGEPLLGGAASRMGKGTRNLYTNVNPAKTLYDTSNRVQDGNSLITQEMLNATTSTERSMLLKWISWVDIHSSYLTDADPDNDHRVWGMGASLHSSPIKVNYPGGDVVYFPTTEGVVHAINAADGDANEGTELWAFMPSDFLPYIKTLELNEGAGIPFYGLDGSATYFEVGADKYLIVGERRGDWDAVGHYYTLRITDRTQPELAYSISGGSGSFSKLGQTWSKPKFVNKITINGTTHSNVLVFGGGYDPDQDTATTRVADDVGNAIYIVDAKSGTKIFSISNSGANLNISDMTNAVPSDVSVVDINANGIVDRLYVSDVGGRVIRVDLPETGSAKGGIVADINDGSSDYRKLFNPIEIGYFSRGGHQYLALLLGSGDRANPVAKGFSDRFYMIKDTAVWAAPTGSYEKITQDDLYDATTTISQTLDGADGWFFNLGGSRKVFSQARLYDYAVMFSAYTGEKLDIDDPCTAKPTTGESYFYAVNMRDGNAYFASMDGTDADGDPTLADRSRKLAIPGMPPSPTLIFPTTDANNASLGNEVLALVGLEEVTRWPDRFHPISWEEVINVKTE